MDNKKECKKILDNNLNLYKYLRLLWIIGVVIIAVLFILFSSPREKVRMNTVPPIVEFKGHEFGFISFTCLGIITLVMGLLFREFKKNKIVMFDSDRYKELKCEDVCKDIRRNHLLVYKWFVWMIPLGIFLTILGFAWFNTTNDNVSPYTRGGGFAGMCVGIITLVMGILFFIFKKNKIMMFEAERYKKLKCGGSK
jgi:hypothetical protein